MIDEEIRRLEREAATIPDLYTLAARQEGAGLDSTATVTRIVALDRTELNGCLELLPAYRSRVQSTLAGGIIEIALQEMERLPPPFFESNLVEAWSNDWRYDKLYTTISFVLARTKRLEEAKNVLQRRARDWVGWDYLTQLIAVFEADIRTGCRHLYDLPGCSLPSIDHNVGYTRLGDDERHNIWQSLMNDSEVTQAIAGGAMRELYSRLVEQHHRFRHRFDRNGYNHIRQDPFDIEELCEIANTILDGDPWPDSDGSV